MAFQQRAVGATRSSKGSPSPPLWRPDSLPRTWLKALGVDELPAPQTTDRYVTIDERVGTMIGLVGSRWPTARNGVLKFPQGVQTAWVDADDLQAIVNELRGVWGQESRPLRIGDTFWIRGYQRHPSRWTTLIDITAIARAMTKAIVARAAVGNSNWRTEDEDGEERRALNDDPAATSEDERPPAGPATARPVL